MSKKSYSIQLFIVLAVCAVLPAMLFVLEVISKPTAWIIFIAVALPSIIYCLFPLLIVKREDETNLSGEPMPKLPYAQTAKFKRADMEKKTVTWTHKS